MADVSAGVWMPQSKKQRRCRTGLNPVRQWCWNTRSCYDSPFHNTRLKIFFCTLRGLLMFPCLTWITDSLLHNLCRRGSCLQNAASSVLCFYCLWQWEVHVYSLAPLQHWLLCSATMSSPCALHTGREEQEVSVDQFIPIYARPLDYTAMVPATNTLLKCELCTLAYILHTVEGSLLKWWPLVFIHFIHFHAIKPLWIFRK